MAELNKHEFGTVILGMGIMGVAIANNLEQDGLLVATWNRTVKTNASTSTPRFIESIVEAVSKANILFILVSDGGAVSDVIDLLEPVLTKNHIVVQCATVKPEDNIEFKNRVEACGSSFIEALIGGSKLAAVERKIPLYLGGDASTVNKLEPLLATLSGKRIHVGEVGTASVAKLAMNLNLSMQLEALCESYAYATSNGLSDDQYFNVLRNNTGWNYLCEYKEPKLRNRDYEPQFSVKNMLKDIRLALATDKTDEGMTLLKKTEAIYRTADDSGLGEEDMIALYKLLNN
jgi:3-hydroxyisobutyrate dehydrogenase-like beta-hydroxyacid dehydrogenase